MCRATSVAKNRESYSADQMSLGRWWRKRWLGASSSLLVNLILKGKGDANDVDAENGGDPFETEIFRRWLRSKCWRG